MIPSCSRASTRCVLFFLLLLILANSAAATIFGTIRGTVRDAQGRPVAGAAVTLQSTTAQWRRDLTTGANGAFSFAAVPIGAYKLQVRAAGLASSAPFPVPHPGGHAPRAAALAAPPVDAGSAGPAPP